VITTPDYQLPVHGLRLRGCFSNPQAPEAVALAEQAADGRTANGSLWAL
jgi:hypothetical protein